MVLNNSKQTDMGKGDKKSRRGKIILGTFGVRRPRKKADKAEIKPEKAVSVVKEKKPVKEAKESHAKAEVAAPKAEKPKKEPKAKKTNVDEAAPKESRPRKEPKS